MKRLGIILFFAVLTATVANAAPFIPKLYYQLEFKDNPAAGGLRSCALYFMNGRVPPKREVDRLMHLIMTTCIAMDDSHDIQVEAVRGEDGDALDDTQATFAWLEFDHKTKVVKSVTHKQFIDNLR